MANQEHLGVLNEGVEVWNQWRKENPGITPDLSNSYLITGKMLAALKSWNMKPSPASILIGGDLKGIDLNNVILKGSYLSEANLSESDLYGADLRNTHLDKVIFDYCNLSEALFCGADLTEANFRYVFDAEMVDFSNTKLIYVNIKESDFNNANFFNSVVAEANIEDSDLSGVNLCKAEINGTNFFLSKLKGAKLNSSSLLGVRFVDTDLRETELIGADLRWAYINSSNLAESNFTEANLEYAQIIRSNLDNTTLNSCNIFGISAWGINGIPKEQSNLIITHEDEPKITVDNLEVAQFIYLLLHSDKIRHVIDTITSKAVLILGRFTPERKAVLDAIRSELRRRDYLPILFDFEKPKNRDFTETVSTLARLSKFIIADITDPHSVPQELQAIIPTHKVPVLPLLENSATKYGMFSDFQDYPWVLKTCPYESTEKLLASFEHLVIIPAEDKLKELKKSRRN